MPRFRTISLVGNLKPCLHRQGSHNTLDVGPNYRSAAVLLKPIMPVDRKEEFQCLRKKAQSLYKRPRLLTTPIATNSWNECAAECRRSSFALLAMAVFRAKRPTNLFLKQRRK